MNLSIPGGKGGKNFIRDITWLIVALVTALLICRFILNLANTRDTLDIHIHDTYLILAAEHVFIFLFVVISFFVFFILEALKKFSRTLPNILLLIAGIVLIFFFGIASTWLGSLNSWTIYPPLSGLEDGYTQEQGESLHYISRILLSLQILWVFFLLVIVYMWGRTRR